MIELMRRIPRQRKVSAPELHRQLKDAGFDRDLRTIQRLLDMLSEQFDIERDDRSKPYGYRWKERAQAMSMPALSPQEALLLMLAERHLSDLLPPAIKRSMEGFFIQARSNLTPPTSATLERQWLSKVRVVGTTQPLLPPAIKPGIFEQVSAALFENRWLEVDYLNADKWLTKARVMPLGLAQQGTRLYLVCRFHGYSDDRTLALHRLQAARATTLAFERPKDFDLQRFDDEGRFGLGDGKKIRLSFRVRKDAGLALIESPLSKDQTVKETATYYKISATVIDSGQLDWWLRSWGDAISAVRKQVNTSCAALKRR